MSDSKNHSDWMERAQHDLISARQLLEDEGYTDTIGYLLHQALEKALKASLLQLNDCYPKTHDLVNLVSLLTKQKKNFEDYLEDCQFVNSFYVDGRYPADLSGMPSYEEMKKALKIVENIFDLIVKEIS